MKYGAIHAGRLLGERVVALFELGDRVKRVEIVVEGAQPAQLRVTRLMSASEGLALTEVLAEFQLAAAEVWPFPILRFPKREPLG